MFREGQVININICHTKQLAESAPYDQKRQSSVFNFAMMVARADKYISIVEQLDCGVRIDFEKASIMQCVVSLIALGSFMERVKLCLPIDQPERC